MEPSKAKLLLSHFKTIATLKAASKEELEKALERLYLEEVLPAVKSGLCAAVLTQLSDVEDETNGLVTYDRQIVKVSEETMQGIAKRLLEGN